VLPLGIITDLELARMYAANELNNRIIYVRLELLRKWQSSPWILRSWK